MPTSQILRDALKSENRNSLEMMEFRVDDLVFIPEFQYHETLNKLWFLEQELKSLPRLQQ